MATVGIKAHLDDETRYELTLRVGNQRVNAVEWLSKYDEHLPSASISRQIGVGYAQVWKDGRLIAPEYHHSLGQSGGSQSKWVAFIYKLPFLATKEGALYVVGQFTGPLGGAAASIFSELVDVQPCGGCEEGDISMTFIYPHHDRGAYQPTARTIWYRLHHQRGMLVVDQTWTSTPLPSPFPPSSSWSMQ
jgi:hypothetical protein